MSIEQLIGRTFIDVKGKTGGDEILFIASDIRFRMYHMQNCCESVNIEDICGDLSDLVDSPILHAVESTSSDMDKWPEGADKPDWLESFTWTFYRLATIKGSVVIRWYGSSNGYYSESVELVEETLDAN
jgi:hypothetical protein